MCGLSKLLLLILISSSSYAQCIIDITLRTQKQVDQFPMMYRCTELFGTLTISGDDITNLDGLQGVHSAGKLNIVNNPLLQNLRGLDSLEQIGSSLTITNNESLKNLNNLENLTAVKGDGVFISNNPSLRNLLGLSNVGDIPGAVTIDGNPRIKNLKGLDNISAIGGKFQVSSNDSLVTLNGVQQLTSVGSMNGEGLSITYNPQLKTLEALSSLNSLPGELTIVSNTSLIYLSGLESLTGVGGITIMDNPSLLNLNALSSLTTTPDDASIVVIDNTALVRYCGLFNLISNNFSGDSTSGTITISGNGIGSSATEIIAGGICESSQPAIALGGKTESSPKKN